MANDHLQTNVEHVPDTGIAVILPSRENFRRQDAGAVALTVHAFSLASRYRQALVVFGGQPEHFEDVSYRHMDVKLAWLYGRNRAYGMACVQALRELPEIGLVEVHNRIPLAFNIKKHLPERRVTVHLHNDPQGMDGARTVAERQTLLMTLDRVYCVSNYVRTRILEGVDPSFADKAEVIYNALPVPTTLDTAASDEPERRQPWIVYAGRFIPEKGVLELAQALAQLLPQHPAWRVEFLGAWGFGHEAGKSSYEQSVYAALAKVADQVDFRGHVAHDEVLKVFNQASIAVSPSTGMEAFGRTTLEAMDAGCAVITSSSCGLQEVAGDTAVVVDPVSASGLAAAIGDLIDNPLKRVQLAAQGRQRAQTVFSLSQQVAHLDAARERLLSHAQV